MPDGPEREAVIREAARIWIAYLPINIRVHRIAIDLLQPWVSGYVRHPNVHEFCRYVDVDTARVSKI